MTIAIVETETCNLASVQACLRRLGCDFTLASRPEHLAGARALLLPGVGAFTPAMQRLRRRGFIGPLSELLEASAEGRGPFVVAICLGFQLLARSSAEGEADAREGLGAHAGRVEPLPQNERVPHIGWNDVSAAGTLSAGEAYFAHSYALFEAPAGWNASWCAHGDRFVAAVRRGRVTGAQFHPELSGAWGQRFMAQALGLEDASC